MVKAIDNMRFDERVWEICRMIPKGKVTTYAAIADALDSRAYRAVGQALKRNPNAPAVPCHRVVRSNGSVGGYRGRTDQDLKRRMLLREGVKIMEGYVDLKSCLFVPEKN